MKKALIYCRVSTEEQAKEGHHSLSAQEYQCKKIAKEKKYYITDIFIDPGASGKNINRPALKKLLKRCKEDKSINAVIVQHTDRLARNTLNHLQIRDCFEENGIELFSYMQPSLDNTPYGKAMDAIVAVMSQLQSDTISEKTISGLEDKVRNGGWPRPAPLGYNNVTDKNGNKIVMIDQFVGPLIKEAFQLYSTGNYSVQTVADKLYEKGFRSKTGKQIQNSRMTALLKNKFYIGEINWRNINTKGNHKPLISKNIFNTVQEVIKSHNHNVCRSRKYSYLLSGYLYCDICKSRYTGETHPEKNATYYRCTKRINHKEKFSKTVDLEKQVEEKFEGLEFSEEFINLVVKKVKHLFKVKQKGIDKQKKVLINQRQAIENKRNVAEEKLFSGVISDEDFQRVKENFREQIDILQNQIDEMNRIKGIKVDEIHETLKLTKNISQAYKEAPERLKRHYLSLFWDRFEVRDREVVNAIPTKIFAALQKDIVVSYMANVPKTKSLLSTNELVKIRDFWGPLPIAYFN